MTARIAWITIAPVKSLALREVDEVELTVFGVRGDRRFYLVDETGRMVNNKGLGVLQQVRPDYDTASGTLALSLPGGDVVSAAVELGPELETIVWGRAVAARPVVGPWSDALSSLSGKNLRLVEAAQPAVDRARSGGVSIVSTGALQTLAGRLGVDAVDSRRFRMNFGVEGVAPHAEDGWIGRRVRIGDAVVVPQGNVGRCAVTTQNPETGLRDLDTLRALAEYRGDTESTEPLPFGVYAAVLGEGRVRVGDPVEPS